jgi:hypothetical protein
MGTVSYYFKLFSQSTGCYHRVLVILRWSLFFFTSIGDLGLPEPEYRFTLSSA